MTSLATALQAEGDSHLESVESTKNPIGELSSRLESIAEAAGSGAEHLAVVQRHRKTSEGLEQLLNATRRGKTLSNAHIASLLDVATVEAVLANATNSRDSIQLYARLHAYINSDDFVPDPFAKYVRAHGITSLAQVYTNGRDVTPLQKLGNPFTRLLGLEGSDAVRRRFLELELVPRELAKYSRAQQEEIVYGLLGERRTIGQEYFAESIVGTLAHTNRRIVSSLARTYLDSIGVMHLGQVIGEAGGKKSEFFNTSASLGGVFGWRGQKVNSEVRSILIQYGVFEAEIATYKPEIRTQIVQEALSEKYTAAKDYFDPSVVGTEAAEDNCAYVIGSSSFADWLAKANLHPDNLQNAKLTPGQRSTLALLRVVPEEEPIKSYSKNLEALVAIALKRQPTTTEFAQLLSVEAVTEILTESLGELPELASIRSALVGYVQSPLFNVEPFAQYLSSLGVHTLGDVKRDSALYGKGHMLGPLFGWKDARSGPGVRKALVEHGLLRPNLAEYSSEARLKIFEEIFEESRSSAADYFNPAIVGKETADRNKQFAVHSRELDELLSRHAIQVDAQSMTAQAPSENGRIQAALKILGFAIDKTASQEVPLHFQRGVVFEYLGMLGIIDEGRVELKARLKSRAGNRYADAVRMSGSQLEQIIEVKSGSELCAREIKQFSVYALHAKDGVGITYLVRNDAMAQSVTNLAKGRGAPVSVRFYDSLKFQPIEKEALDELEVMSATQRNTVERELYSVLQWRREGHGTHEQTRALAAAIFDRDTQRIHELGLEYACPWMTNAQYSASRGKVYDLESGESVTDVTIQRIRHARIQAARNLEKKQARIHQNAAEKATERSVSVLQPIGTLLQLLDRLPVCEMRLLDDWYQERAKDKPLHSRRLIKACARGQIEYTAVSALLDMRDNFPDQLDGYLNSRTA